MKLWKFKVEDISGENILGHPQGGNLLLKPSFYDGFKVIEKYLKNRLQHEM